MIFDLNMKINNYSLVNTIKKHSDSITSLILLKDKRIASSSEDYTIKIFNPENDFHCDITINNKTEFFSICQLDNGLIASLLSSHNIALWSIVDCSYQFVAQFNLLQQSEIGENDSSYSIGKIVSLSGISFAICTEVPEIIIWKDYETKKILKASNEDVISILFIKERNVLISGGYDSKVRIWNMTSFQCVSLIDGAFCIEANSLTRLDDNKIGVGGDRCYAIINIDKCIIEDKISMEDIDSINCSIKLNDGNILCGCFDGDATISSIKEHNSSVTYLKIHKKCITDFLKINEKTFVSCSKDGSIKVWKEI